MAYAFVQQKDASAAASSTTLASGNFVSNVTAGNFILVVAAYSNASAQTVTCADTLGNTYVEVGSGIFSAGSSTGFRILYAKNISGGTNQVTATYGAACTNRGIYCVEYSGVDIIDPYFSGEIATQEQSAPGTGANAISSGNTPTLQYQPALVFGFSYDVTGGTGNMVAGTGFTSRQTSVWLATLGLEGCAEDKRVTSTSATSATFTDAAFGGSNVFLTAAVVFSEPNGPGIDTQPNRANVYVGQAANFTVSATTSGGALSYQWKDDGANVGTNSNSYTTPANTLSDSGSVITCDITDANGTTTSNGAILNVMGAANYPWTKA